MGCMIRSSATTEGNGIALVGKQAKTRGFADQLVYGLRKFRVAGGCLGAKVDPAGVGE